MGQYVEQPALALGEDCGDAWHGVWQQPSKSINTEPPWPLPDQHVATR